MEKTYKYRFSRRAIYWTLVYLVVFVLLGWLLYHLYEGGYLSAWFTSFIVALIALMSLSIPRRIVAYEVIAGNVGRNADELLRRVQASQFVAEHGDQVCPAKWQPGASTLKPSLDLVGII